MKIIQTREKLSKIEKVFNELSNEVKNVENHFSNKEEKIIYSKAKSIKKVNVFAIIFFLNHRYFFIHSRSSFVAHSQRNSIDETIVAI